MEVCGQGAGAGGAPVTMGLGCWMGGRWVRARCWAGSACRWVPAPRMSADGSSDTCWCRGMRAPKLPFAVASSNTCNTRHHPLTIKSPLA